MLSYYIFWNTSGSIGEEEIWLIHYKEGSYTVLLPGFHCKRDSGIHIRHCCRAFCFF